MNVNGVDTWATAVSTYYATTTSKKTEAETAKSNSQEPAATVQISAAGRQNLELKTYGPEDFHFANMDEVLARHRELKEQGLQEPKRIDPFDDPFQLRGVTYQFFEGSLEKSLTDYLEGKAINPSLVAAELSKMLKGTYSNPSATVEERAIIRETAIQNAEYIAQNYFSDLDEANGFMDLVRKAAEKDILREKGYYAFDNSDKIFKPYCKADGMFTLNAYAEIYGISMEELEDPDKSKAFYEALAKNYSSWERIITNNFNNNEKRVADIITAAIQKVSETAVNNSLQRLLKAFP